MFNLKSEYRYYYNWLYVTQRECQRLETLRKDEQEKLIGMHGHYSKDFLI